VVGTIVGVFMLGFINNGLNLLGVSGYYQYVFKGAIILIAVIVETLQHRGS
jgi:ribose/xylose/arabinose/galactoside ABC-type transport system permease subunit